VKGFFIAGTDTSVGKTEVARALCVLLRERGWAPLALKPVETGCAPDAPEDALALREACGSAQALDDLCPYRFRLPAAPLVAAEAEGRSIDLLRIEEIVARASAPIVVEAAGGLLVPLARESELVTNLGLADRLGLPVLLVGRASLGTLNHCALSVEAIERRGLQLVAVVLNRTVEQDDPSVESNPRWAGELTGARVLGPTPFVADSKLRPRLLAPFVDSMVPRR